jgi:hypothetical protein
MGEGMQPLRIDKPDSLEHGAASAAGPVGSLNRGQGVGLATGSDLHYNVLESARSRLANTPFPVLRGVVCQYDRGVLILRGRLPSFYLKSVAQEAIRNLAGVRQVVNEIEVGG